MGRFLKKSNSRHLFLQWLVNYWRDPSGQFIELLLESANEVIDGEYDSDFLRSLINITMKNKKQMLTELKAVFEFNKLRNFTSIIAFAAFAEFWLLDRNPAQKPLMISEYLKLSDNYITGGQAILHVVLDKALR